MTFLQNKLYWAVALGHFISDVFANMRSVIVAFLSAAMGLSPLQIGIAVGGYQLLSAFAQPAFGWLADKIGSRWIGPISVGWTIAFMALGVLVAETTGSFLLFFLTMSMSALGSGAFHPQGTMHAANIDKDNAATATAVFFLFGQFGLALGPLLAGALLEQVGPTGIYGFAFVTVPLVLFITYAMSNADQERVAEMVDQVSSIEMPDIDVKEAIRWGAIGLLAALIGLRSWVFLGTVDFLPALFQEMGWTPTAYGGITGIFWMASAIGGVLAGGWADRWGRRQVVFVTLLVGSVPLYFLPLTSSWWAFPLAVIIGGLVGSSHSILMVIAQDLLPGRKAMASGIALGYMFGTGAIATAAIGALAGTWALGTIIQWGSALGVIAAILALYLPATRQELKERELRERVPA